MSSRKFEDSRRRPLRKTACGLAAGWLAASAAVAQTPLSVPPPPRGAEASAFGERLKLAQAHAAYQRGDLAGAARQYDQLARAGSRVAQFNLAVMHVRGEVPAPDADTALLLLRASAAHGLPDAMAALGESYETGLLTPKDLAQSFHWYRQAADLGHVGAAVATATAYYLGRGIANDPAMAAQYYLQAARGGDVGAQYLYASMCETGLGVARDLRLARYWYEAAARNGDLGAAVKVRELTEP